MDINKRRQMPPSQKKDLSEKQKSLAEQHARTQDQRLRQAMAITFSTSDGKVVLDWLRRACQHGITPLGATLDGKISPEITVYNAMRQDLYLTLRKMIPRNILIEVEYDAENTVTVQ